MGVHAPILLYRERLESRRIRNKEIAEAVGVNEHTVARWVKNEVNMINVQVLEAFCNYFECDVGDLLYMERDAGS
jgi:DNA-binding Xre family transcriptional regulator